MPQLSTARRATVDGGADDKRLPNSRPLDEAVSEFDKKYPPDTYGEEMSDTARVWTVYRDQASEYDKSHIDGWNKTLDILLIFAGLFSAVATTFIGESYQQLQTDWNEYTGRLLFAALTAQTTPGKFTLPASLQSMAPAEFSASGLARLINGLWVSSLVLSLAVALLSILAKQWLVQFESRVTAPVRSTRDWAHRRVLYAEGLKRWHFAYMIASLPALLHLSLVLFLAGLALFFWTLDKDISAAVLVLTAILVAFYFSTIFLSYRYRACPFYISWFTQVHRALNFVHKHIAKRPPLSEAQLMETTQAHLSASVLTWLATYSPAHEVNAVAIYAIGALRSGSKVIEEIRKIDASLKRSLIDKLADLHEVVYTALLGPSTASDTSSSQAEELIDDDDLPMAAYNYFRVGHVVDSLDLGVDSAGDTRRPRGDVLAGNAASSLVERVAQRVLWLKRSCPGQMLSLNASLHSRSDADIELDIYLLQKGLVDRRWAPHATHITQTLERLQLYNGNPALRCAVALRLVHCTLVDHVNTANLQEHLSLLSSLFPGYQPSVTIHVDQTRNSHLPLLAALELYNFIVVHAGDYSITSDVISLLLTDLTHISRRLLAVRESPGPHLAALIATDRLQSVEPGCPALDPLVKMIFTVSPLDYVSGLSIALSHLITIHPAVGRALLEVDRSNGVSCWRNLCTSLLSSPRPVADTWGLVSCASALFDVLNNEAPSPQRQVLAAELFSVDFLSPALKVLTTDAILDSLPEWETKLNFIVCGMVQSLAPDAWPTLRDDMYSHASDAVRRREVWTQFTHAN